MWGRIYPHVLLLILANTIFKVSCKGNGSLTFLIDDTSSMGDDIDQVRKSVDRITRIVKHEKSSLIDNMVLVTFNDPDVNDRIVTRDPEEFKKALSRVNPHINPNAKLDCWEPSMKGLLQALTKSKNDSYIFVFTDAPAKDYNNSQYVIEMCQRKQTQIVFVLTGTFCRKHPYVSQSRDVYFDIAVACSGLAIFVNKNEVHKMFGPIEEIIKGNKAVITTASVPPGVSTNIPFTIDDYTDYVIISASGKNVTLKLNEHSVSVKKIMTTDNAIVIKLSYTKPGNYVATVKGKTKTSVVITGRTDFFFTHGFSELKPKSLSDTSPQPKSEAKGYLSVSVTDENHSVRIEAAIILDMDGKQIVEKLPLTEISKNFYISEPFVPPSQRFKVGVEGIDKATKKLIKRTAKIPVSPPPPSIAPKVEGVTVMKVTKGKTAEIECKVVIGFPAPKITWLFWGKTGSNFTTLPGSESVLRITNVEDKHAGQYKCVAKNIAGKDEHVTTLFVQDRPIISSVDKIHEGTEGDALLRIPCIAAGLPKPSITWKLNGLVIHPNVRYSIQNGTLIIRDPKVSDTNSYTCEAKNEVGAVTATFRTDINQAPQVSGVTSKKVKIGTPANIECTVIKGKPKPTITWRFMDNSGSDLSIPGSDNVLNISRVEYKHAGRYMCVAKNKVGSNEHITTLEVQDLPKIVSNVSNILESTEGDALLEIPCVAAGLPKPSITWKLNGLVINPNVRYSIQNGTLIIRDPKVSDTNSYTCEAKNEVGADSATFRTNINQVPQVSGVTNKKVRIGTPASIECTVVKGEPKPTITWQFMENSGSDSPILGSDNVLHISMVETKHAGRYKCVAQNKVGSNEHITTLEVQDLPKIVSNISNILESIEGDALLEIPCVAAGLPKPSITWKLNGLVINPSVRYSIQNGTLIIRDLKISDTNSYTCEAKNEVGADSATFRTNINQVPQVSGVTNKKVRIGTPASIECTVVKGEPKPTITWQFMENSGSDSPILGSDNVLHISMVETKHAGRYKCVAQNKVGSNEHITTLEVQDLPKIVSNISNILESIEGDALLGIPCVAAGLPKPSITWKLNGLVINPNVRYSIQNGTLIIRDPKISDTNSYTCEAKNEVGADSATFRTNINQAPQVSGVTSKKVKIGTSAKIDCTVIKGKPKPTITWRFMDNSGSDLSIPGSENVLHISRVENKHAGRYKCVAKNKVGSDEHVTTLFLESLPRITTKSRTVKGIEGDLALRIPCDVVGIPQAVVTWHLNGTKITPDGRYSIEDGALVIAEPEKNDSSVYTCEAKNNIGSTSTPFQVAVENCILNINKDFPEKQPIMYSPSLEWPVFPVNKGYMIIPHADYFYLNCPSEFSNPNLPKKSNLMAFCERDNTIKMNGNIYNFADIQCNQEVKPEVVKTGTPCLQNNRNTETIKIGYRVYGKFLGVYEVCLDKKNNVPLFTEHTLSPDHTDRSTEADWSNSLLPQDFDTLYDCRRQMYDISTTLGRGLLTHDSCCFGKRQLVNSHNLLPGVPTSSAYDYLNVIPHWSTCNSKNWDDVEQSVRNLVKSAGRDLIITTGTAHDSGTSATDMTLHDGRGGKQPVAPFLWKVVQDRVQSASLAVIQLNIPELSPEEALEYVLCTDICANMISWIEPSNWHNVEDGYTYCCTITEFEKAFGYNGRFSPGMTKVLFDGYLDLDYYAKK